MCEGCVCHECEYRTDCDRCHTCYCGDFELKTCDAYDKKHPIACGWCGACCDKDICCNCGNLVK